MAPGSGAAGAGLGTQCQNGGVLGWVQGATSSFRNAVCPLCSFISRMTAQHRINSELNLRKKD